MYALSNAQQFIQQFRAAAPQYTQPVSDYRVETDNPLTLELAWPMRKIAVEFTSKSVRMNPPDWKVFSLARYSTAAVASFIYKTLIPALDA